jgi:galactose mutarotase-like enzyme
MLMNDPVFGPSVLLEDRELRAAVAPRMGMSLVSFRVKDVEILDQSRKEVFLKCRKGLGPLILPHFNQQGSAPAGLDLSGFSHVNELEKLGIRHPFQHGVGRYSSWEFEHDKSSVKGRLAGDMRLGGFRLAELNSGDFRAEVTYRLSGGALEIKFAVEGERSVQAGIHFYYDLKDRAKAKAVLPVKGGKKEFRFNEAYDLPLEPEGDGNKTVTYRLETNSYSLDTLVGTEGPAGTRFENVILFSPENASFACIEPLSRLDREKGTEKFRGKIRLRPSVPDSRAG